jgi:hypothetical protein
LPTLGKGDAFVGFVPLLTGVILARLKVED